VQIKQRLYELLTLCVLLVMLYAAFNLLSALQTLPALPLDPLLVLSHSRLNVLAGLCAELALLTGFLAGGIAIFQSVTASLADSITHRLRIIYGAWLLLVIAALGNALIQGGPQPLLIVGFGLLLGAAAYILRSGWRLTTLLRVWIVGVGLAAAFLLADLLLGPDNALLYRLRWLVAYPLAGVGLAFWLMRRFSQVSANWVESGAINVGGLLVLAGLLLSMTTLHPAVAVGALLIAPTCYMIFAAHSYRAFSTHNATYTLAGHWLALAIILLGVGVGVLSAFLSLPAIGPLIASSAFVGLRDLLLQWGLLAIVLSLVNQVSAELRGVNRRVTGLMPFWMVSAGVIGGGFVLALTGSAQVYTGVIFGIEAAALESALQPFRLLHALSAFVLACGVAIYALGFWARRL